MPSRKELSRSGDTSWRGVANQFWHGLTTRICLYFTLSYRPGSRNEKADALSGQFDFQHIPGDPKGTAIPSCLVCEVTWCIESQVNYVFLNGSLFSPDQALLCLGNVRGCALPGVLPS